MTMTDTRTAGGLERVDRPAIVKNAASSHFSLVDLDRREVVTELGTGRYPHTARFHPDGRHAYLLYIASAHLEVVDLETLTTIARLDDLGTAPVGSAMTAAGDRLFVGTAAGLPTCDDPGVMAFEVDDDAVPRLIGTQPLGRVAGMRLGQDGRLYVARKRAGTVAGLTADGSLERLVEYPVGTKPHDLYRVPDTASLAVNMAGTASAAFIDLAAETVTSVETGVNPHGIAFAEGPDYRYALFPAREDTRIALVDIGADGPPSTVSLIDVGTTTGFAATSPDGRYAVVDAYEEAFVTIVDLTDRSVACRVPVGGEPLHVVFGPDGTECYVGNMATDAVTVLDTAPLLDGRPANVDVTDRIEGLGRKPSGIFPAEVAA